MSSLAAGAASAASAAGVSPLWYATRATGVVALLLLTGTVVAGIAGTARAELPGLPRVVLAGVHRNLSLLAVGLVVIHVLTTVLDPFAGISLAAAVIPFSSAYRTVWLGLGAVALDLLLAVLLSSLVRDRLSYRSWRAVHWLAYASWPVALWHGLGTGTDTRLPVLLAVDAAVPGRRGGRGRLAAVPGRPGAPAHRGDHRADRDPDGDCDIHLPRPAAARLGPAGRHPRAAARRPGRGRAGPADGRVAPPGRARQPGPARGAVRPAAQG